MFYSVDIEATVLVSLEVEADSIKEAREKAKDEFSSDHDAISIITLHAYEHPEHMDTWIEGDT